jgi:shikimate dehydrogenase
VDRFNRLSSRRREAGGSGVAEFRAAGVMGWPVAHSRSPALHGFWLRRYGIAGAYLPFPVPPERLEAALRGLAALGFAGCNVTVPHKEAVLALVDAPDPLARRIGAVNLVVVRSDRSLEGRNTDAYGFLANLRAACPGWQADAGPAVVLGAGGAARAVLAALADARCPEIRLLNRTRARAEGLQAFGAAIEVLDWERRAAALEGAALLVNTTSLGMHGQPPLALDLAALPRAAVVADLVYVPLETALLAAARARGNLAVDGLGMLLHQAVPSFEAWFGVRPEVTEALRASIAATL